MRSLASLSGAVVVISVAVAPIIATLAGCPPAPPPIEVDDHRDAGPSPDAGPSSSAATYCESIVEFFCPYYLRCGRMAVADEAACREVFLETCNARYEPSYTALAEAGLLELSAEGIEACRNHLEDVPCEEQLLDLDGPCAGMWAGTQPAGAACGFDVESFTCAPGTACVLDVTFCGTCERVVADGEPCDQDGVTCGRESLCDSGFCVARRRVGQSCGPDDRCVLGATCADDNVCRGPAYVGVDGACDFDHRCPYAATCIAGTCRATAGLDEECDDSTPCHSGSCHVDPQSAEGTCVELSAQGAACDDGVQCQTGSCLQGRCATLPSACFNPASPGTGG